MWSFFLRITQGRGVSFFFSFRLSLDWNFFLLPGPPSRWVFFQVSRRDWGLPFIEGRRVLFFYASRLPDLSIIFFFLFFETPPFSFFSQYLLSENAFFPFADEIRAGSGKREMLNSFSPSPSRSSGLSCFSLRWRGPFLFFFPLPAPLLF